MNILKKLFGGSQPKQQLPSTQDVEKNYKELVHLLSQFKRTAYIPVIKKTEKSFSTASKIGGFPYLRNEEDWPKCPNCKKHMQLFVQLNMQELPNMNMDGVAQLFYCINDEEDCESTLESFFPFSKGSVSRIVKTSGDSAKIIPDLVTPFPEKVITTWKAADDFPHYEEYQQLGIDMFISDEVFELLEERKECQPLEGDKLFGWPYWVQGMEYPEDSDNHTQMELLFQLDSEINLPYMFGDSGIGHLTQSLENPDKLAFGWACY